jgi:DNA polymerase III epsilon subunit-like protein
MKHKEFLQTPAASAGEPKFRAVALDCEMAGIAGGAGEVILLCVTDYVTGALLLNRLVCPREKITQMRSSIHGISKYTLDNAILQGQALSGWEEARSELWKYIDNNTILVGHALEHDLDALRIIHPRIVDSAILSRNAVGIRRIRCGLQTLCSEILNVEIRKNNGGIHDCLEDVLATREVVLFCTRNKEAFQSWAEVKEREEMRLEKEREIARQEKKNEQAMKDGGGISSHTYHALDKDEEVLNWSDIAEDLGWPHPDTGYDPWSD